MDGLMVSVHAAQRPGGAESIAAVNDFTSGLHSPARHRHGLAAQRRGRRTFPAGDPEHTWPNTPLDERLRERGPRPAAGDRFADPAKVDVNGGAIAVGHPLGASGTRPMTTFVHALHQRGARCALQAMCEADGLANATILEVLT